METKTLRTNFFYPEIKDTDYLFGSQQIVGNILRSDKDWRGYTPLGELQKRNGVESFACYVEASQHAISTILDEQYGVLDSNFSSRFNDIYAGGTISGGDPLKAAQSFRDNGLIPETSLPFSPEINTWEKFKSFTNADMNECIREGKDWLTKWDTKYDIVVKREYDLAQKYVLLKDALHYSPIAVSIYGQVDEQGNYVPKPQGVSDTHLVELVYIDDNNIPTIFDTYEPFVKQLPANYNFDFGVRWTVEKAVTPAQIGIFMQILQKLSQWLGIIAKQQTTASTPIVPPTPVLPQIQPSTVPSRDLLQEFCDAITAYEGGPGDLNHRNCNPGNVRF